MSTGACGGGACGVELTDLGPRAVSPAGALCNAHAAGFCSADKVGGACAATVQVRLGLGLSIFVTSIFVTNLRVRVRAKVRVRVR